MADQPNDVVIVGGGLIGRTLAVALVSQQPDLAVTVVDAAGDTRAPDDRASAITAAARRMLMRIGVWPDVAPGAEPMHAMTLTDSSTRDAIRPELLSFEGDVEPGEPFAFMVPNADLMTALERRGDDLGLTVRRDRALIFDADPETATTVLALAGGERLNARLLVAADGVRSRLRAIAGIDTVGHGYDQLGLTATVAHERPHGGRAIQHFLPGGPFAILPLAGNRSAIVWTEARDIAERLAALDDFTFELELERRFGTMLGPITLAGGRHAYPLILQIARRFVADRFALVGDAAHTIHPLAGQGLNIGLADVAALAEVAIDTHRLGLDIGGPEPLERYERWRRGEVVRMGLATDGLNLLFSNDSELTRLIRAAGLAMVDRARPLKRAFIREASGLAADAPRLLRGEPV